MVDELTALIANRSALVVESQTPIALEIQELLLEHGAVDVRLAGSLAEARRLLDGGFKPEFAIVDLARFDADADDFVGTLHRAGVALVLTMATPGSRSEQPPTTIVVTKPYFEHELLNALTSALRAARDGV